MPPHSPGARPGGQARPVSEGALAALLGDLGARIRRGHGLAREVAEPLAFCPTGVAALDAGLGGGFPRGRLSELCGAPSSGRTSLAMQLLAETLTGDGLAAWIDAADAFDPGSAAEALAARSGAGGTGGTGNGAEALRRLLWVRARSEREALRCCERVLASEGFALVVLDLAHTRGVTRGITNGVTKGVTKDAPDRARPASGGIPDAGWLRLARLSARQRSAFVVLSESPRAGSRAELVLEMRRGRARFTTPPALLDALETTAVLRRHRTRPTGRAVPLSLTTDPDPIALSSLPSSEVLPDAPDNTSDNTSDNAPAPAPAPAIAANATRD